jgi:hypothetical protein
MFLSLYGPQSLVILMGSWVIGLIGSFALIQRSLSFSANPVSFGADRCEGEAEGGRARRGKISYSAQW